VSEFDELIDGYEGAPSSVGERRDDSAEVPGSTPGGLIEDVVDDEPPFDPDDWPEEETAEILGPEPELRALRPDQRPVRGRHYVIFNGIPMPVVRDNFGATEDEFVRSQLDVDGLKDPDGQRQDRADRALRLRFRGYVCGEMSSL
jgi:hypothetical protein